MSISGQQSIQIGNVNSPVNSDSLYDAFTKIDDNFNVLFSCSSPYTSFAAGTGINVTSTSDTILITNTGVTKLYAGQNIFLSASNGAVTISATGGGNGGNGGGITDFTLESQTLQVLGGNVNTSGQTTFINLPTQGNVSPGTYSYANVTVDGYGRVTNIQNGGNIGTVQTVQVVANANSGITVTGSGNANVNPLFYLDNAGVTKIVSGSPSLKVSNGGVGNVTISLTGGNGIGTVTSVGIVETTGMHNFSFPANNIVTTSGNLEIALSTDVSVSNSVTTNTLAANTVSTQNISALGNTTLNALTVTGLATLSDTSTTGNATFSRRVSLGNVGNVNINGGNSGQALVTNGNGNLSWSTVTTNAAGSNGQIQFNSNGAFAASPNLTFNGTTLSTYGGIFSNSVTIGNGIYMPNVNTVISMGAYGTANALTLEYAESGNSYVSTVSADYVNGMVSNYQPAIDTIGTLTNLHVNGNAYISNTVYAQTFVGNISGNVVAPGFNTQVSFNRNGSLAGDGNLRFDFANSILYVQGNGVNASYFAGQGANLYQLNGANVTGQVPNSIVSGTVYTNAQPNITSVGILEGLQVANTATMDHVYANLFSGPMAAPNGSSNGQLLINSGGYLDTNPALTLDTASNMFTVLGNLNVSDGYYIGDGGYIANINPQNINGTVPVANVANYVLQPHQLTVTLLGNLESLQVDGTATLASANIAAGFVNTLTANSITAMKDCAFDANVVVAGNLDVLGTITSTSSNVVVIDDLYIEVAGNAATLQQLDGAGLLFGPESLAGLEMTYSYAKNAVDLTGNLAVAGALVAATLSGDGHSITNITGAQVTGYVPNANHANAAGTVDNLPASQIIASLGYTPAATTGTNASGTWPINITGSAPVSQLAHQLGQSGGSTPMTFNWSGQGGQPTWLWGGNDGQNMYVYNPSNFSVSYAGTAGTINNPASNGYGTRYISGGGPGGGGNGDMWFQI